MFSLNIDVVESKIACLKDSFNAEHIKKTEEFFRILWAVSFIVFKKQVEGIRKSIDKQRDISIDDFISDWRKAGWDISALLSNHSEQARKLDVLADIWAVGLNLPVRLKNISTDSIVLIN